MQHHFRSVSLQCNVLILIALQAVLWSFFCFVKNFVYCYLNSTYPGRFSTTYMALPKATVSGRSVSSESRMKADMSAPCQMNLAKAVAHMNEACLGSATVWKDLPPLSCFVQIRGSSHLCFAKESTSGCTSGSDWLLVSSTYRWNVIIVVNLKTAFGGW